MCCRCTVSATKYSGGTSVFDNAKSNGEKIHGAFDEVRFGYKYSKESASHYLSHPLCDDHGLLVYHSPEYFMLVVHPTICPTTCAMYEHGFLMHHTSSFLG